MSETNRISAQTGANEPPPPLTSEDMISRLRSLCEAARMIGDHVAAIHLQVWHAIDDLSKVGLTTAKPTSGSDVSLTELSELLTPKEVAQILGVCRATLLRMRNSGRFPEPIYMSARKLRYRRRDLTDWLEKNADVGRLEGPSSTASAP